MSVMLEVKDLKKWFPVTRTFLGSIFSRRRLYVRAVDGISFKVNRGEIVGLVGESGSGKTTTAKLIMRLIEPTDGRVILDGRDIYSLVGFELKKFRREVQIVYQDPYDSLSERMRVFDIVSEPLRIHKIDKLDQRVAETLKISGLNPPEAFYDKYPHELSGGQRQRVAIARALVLQPKLLIADEPVSMIDVSIRAGILNLFLDLRRRFNLVCLVITHDIAVARYICDTLTVMYLGKVVEKGPVEEVVHSPLHPYTIALMSVVPIPDPTASRRHLLLRGEISSPISIPRGCRFHPRCRYATEVCKMNEPEFTEFTPNHLVACHHASRLLRKEGVGSV